MPTMTIYRCPKCGGEINFNSDQQKLVCPYCDTTFEVSTLEEYQKQIEQVHHDDMQWHINNDHDTLESDNLVIYSCGNCGGQIITDKETIATTCPYCNSPVVMNDLVIGQLKPDYVIPFKLNRKNAKNELKTYFDSKALLPRSFKNDSVLNEIKGLYVPFWTFHCKADISQQYQGKKVRRYEDDKYEYTETKYYCVIREGEVKFDNVPVDGSSKIDDEYMQSIEPFNFKDAVSFKTAYLAGYFADKYDEDAKASEPKANKRIKNSSKNVFSQTMSDYDYTTLERSNITLSDKKVDYYLLPVWILNLTWQDKMYTIVMNGQTGKMIGDLPADKLLFFKTVMIVTLISSFIIFIILSITMGAK